MQALKALHANFIKRGGESVYKESKSKHGWPHWHNDEHENLLWQAEMFCLCSNRAGDGCL